MLRKVSGSSLRSGVAAQKGYSSFDPSFFSSEMDFMIIR